MIQLNAEYVRRTLEEERLWKKGESDTFLFGRWILTLKKEDSGFSVSGVSIHGGTVNKQHENMSDAFLDIMNRFNENPEVENRFKTIDQVLKLKY